jgi:hypothetical protein
MHIQAYVFYRLPDGTCLQAVPPQDRSRVITWELRHPGTGVLEYTIGPHGTLTGYAICEEGSGPQRVDPFRTDITVDDLEPISRWAAFQFG